MVTNNQPDSECELNEDCKNAEYQYDELLEETDKQTLIKL